MHVHTGHMRRAVKIDEDSDGATTEPPPEGQAERVMAAMNFSAVQRREVRPCSGLPAP